MLKSLPVGTKINIMNVAFMPSLKIPCNISPFRFNLSHTLVRFRYIFDRACIVTYFRNSLVHHLVNDSLACVGSIL